MGFDINSDLLLEKLGEYGPPKTSKQQNPSICASSLGMVSSNESLPVVTTESRPRIAEDYLNFISKPMIKTARKRAEIRADYNLS